MGKALILNLILSTYSLRKCIEISLENLYLDIRASEVNPLIIIQNPNHVMHIDGKEIGTNFQFLDHFILFNFFASFTAPHKQAHRRYLRINNVCATASKYKQPK